MTYAQYLVAEAMSEVKHDYVDGEVSAIEGGTIEHGALGVAIGDEIRSALKGKPCRTFSSDVRVRVESTGGTFYPNLEDGFTR